MVSLILLLFSIDLKIFKYEFSYKRFSLPFSLDPHISTPFCRICCGFGGALFVFVHRKIVDFRRTHRNTKLGKILDRKYVLPIDLGHVDYSANEELPVNVSSKSVYTLNSLPTATFFVVDKITTKWKSWMHGPNHKHTNKPTICTQR